MTWLQLLSSIGNKAYSADGQGLISHCLDFLQLAGTHFRCMRSKCENLTYILVKCVLHHNNSWYFRLRGCWSTHVLSGHGYRKEPSLYLTLLDRFTASITLGDLTGYKIIVNCTLWLGHARLQASRAKNIRNLANIGSMTDTTLGEERYNAKHRCEFGWPMKVAREDDCKSFLASCPRLLKSCSAPLPSKRSI